MGDTKAEEEEDVERKEAYQIGEEEIMKKDIGYIKVGHGSES